MECRYCGNTLTEKSNNYHCTHCNKTMMINYHGKLVQIPQPENKQNKRAVNEILSDRYFINGKEMKRL